MVAKDGSAASLRGWRWAWPLVVLLAACAGPGAVQRMQVRLQEVQSVAGQSVESFHFWRLDRWEPLGREHVLVWTRLDTAYLLRVDGPCPGLDFAHAIGLTSNSGRVYRRFDHLLFEDQRCRLGDIRPIDTRALKALRAERRAQG